MNINGKDIQSIKDYFEFLTANQPSWERRERNKKYFIDQLKKGKSFKKKKINNQSKLF